MTDLFKARKPVIAMLHAQALPGRPRHDANRGMQKIAAALAQDLDVLQRAGVDGVLFCNEADLPYQLQTGPEIAAAMAALIGALKDKIHVPFGVDIVWDPVASLATAQATGGSFVREVFTGTYESDLGLMQPIFPEKGNVKVFANITPEFASAPGRRTTADRAKSAVYLGVDAVLVTGPITGSPTSLEDLRTVKEAVPGTPVLASTGVTADTVNETLKIADGVIVGTHLKRDGVTWNPVDPARAAAFMAEAGKARAKAR